jgi:hypothetical protein
MFLPKCRPIRSYRKPFRSANPQVCEQSLAVRTTVYPFFDNSSMIGLKNGTCGELSRSIHIFLLLDPTLMDDSPSLIDFHFLREVI